MPALIYIVDAPPVLSDLCWERPNSTHTKLNNLNMKSAEELIHEGKEQWDKLKTE